MSGADQNPSPIEPESPLPSTEEIVETYGNFAGVQWAEAREGQRRGMWKVLQREGRMPGVSEETWWHHEEDDVRYGNMRATFRAVPEALQRLNDLYGEFGQHIVTDEEDLHDEQFDEKEKEEIAETCRILRLHRHVLFPLLEHGQIKFKEFTARVLRDGMLRDLPKEKIYAAYVSFIEELIGNKDVIDPDAPSH